MKERPILYSAPMVKAILERRKTQTRRVLKESLMYSLTDDRIYGKLNAEVCHEGLNTERDTNFSEQRLYGWIRWSNLFTNEIQRLWEEGVRGLVSVKGTRNKQGISLCEPMPQQQEGDDADSQISVHSISRTSIDKIIAGETFGWEPSQQQTRELDLGNPRRKLVGQESAWKGNRGRETPHGQALRRRMQSLEVGDKDWIVQSTSCSPCSRNVSGWYISYSKWQKGITLWVRETWAVAPRLNDVKPRDIIPPGKMTGGGIVALPCYRADYPSWLPWPGTKWRPSIFMPRWASRITLEIVGVRVERLQDISEEDMMAEGAYPQSVENLGYKTRERMIPWFSRLWDSINGKTYPWDTNPYVWVIEFKVREAR